MVDYSNFKSSLRHLELQYDNYLNSANRLSLTELDKEALAESVIQRFEICYDSLWKALKRYLTDELGIPDTPNSPKPVFRLSFENHLFNTTVEPWLRYAQARVNTSHDYSGEKAEECLALMDDFIENATHLYQKLTGEKWMS